MTKRVESLRVPCLDASSTLATSTSKKTVSAVFFCFGGSVVQPVAFRVTYLWSVDVCYRKSLLLQRAISENKLSDLHPQNQQSSIASTSLRSPLNCGGRSTLFLTSRLSSLVSRLSSLVFRLNKKKATIKGCLKYSLSFSVVR